MKHPEDYMVKRRLYTQTIYCIFINEQAKKDFITIRGIQENRIRGNHICQFRGDTSGNRKGLTRRENGLFMSLYNDRLRVTAGHSVSLCLIPQERLTLTNGRDTVTGLRRYSEVCLCAFADH